MANDTSDYFVMFPSPTVNRIIGSGRIAIGGTVTSHLGANQAEITEHSFLALPTDDDVVLYDNTGGTAANHQLVLFNEPMHDLPEDGTTVDGITVHEHNCNYAIISGTGKLVGKRYTHTKVIVTASNVEEGDDVRAKRVEDNCLINEANSRNTAQRVLEYFSSTDTIRSKIILNNGERAGDLIRFKNPFKEDAEAYVEKMDILATSILGANCEMTEGFNAQFVGNNYTNSDLIIISSTWTVPAGVTHIKLVLISGGAGGSGGYDGQRGAGYNEMGDPNIIETKDPASGLVGTYYPNQPFVDGGDAGKPGSAGNILTLDLDVTPGDTLAFTIGTGGSGGARNGGEGTEGTHTSVDYDGETYTSEDGNVSTTGYLDLFRNVTLGLPGEAGHKGGAGGQTNTISLYGWQYASGLPGGNVGKWIGGLGGKGIRMSTGYNGRWGMWNEASGGGGGGAAWGHNGYNTHYRSYPEATFYNNPSMPNGVNGDIVCAFGGDGASAEPPNKPRYGCGGGGGNGGGSGGNAGLARVTNNFSENPTPRPALQSGGDPGLGSQGGAGGDGCAIVYY